MTAIVFQGCLVIYERSCRSCRVSWRVTTEKCRCQKYCQTQRNQRRRTMSWAHYIQLHCNHPSRGHFSGQATKKRPDVRPRAGRTRHQAGGHWCTESRSHRSLPYLLGRTQEQRNPAFRHQNSAGKTPI